MEHQQYYPTWANLQLNYKKNNKVSEVTVDTYNTLNFETIISDFKNKTLNIHK